jgi:hypothetical protein
MSSPGSVTNWLSQLHAGDPAAAQKLWERRTPAWLSPTVTSIYEERAFDRMPILADPLEDTGCTSADVLGHCRGGGEHVPGCWAVDLVLGR